MMLGEIVVKVVQQLEGLNAVDRAVQEKELDS
jgi:hypothetical protein